MTPNPGTFRYLPPSGVPISLSDILAGLYATFTGDKAIDGFNQEICTQFGVRHALTVSSGRAALSLLFQALQKLHPQRDEVVLPAYTSFSVPSAVINAGLKVSLYDLEVPTLSPDMSSLEQALTDRTLCIVVCNLYGYPCNMDAVHELAASRGIPVIDDAAQAMGATWKGKYAGTLGYAGLFSLSRGKNISTVDGGIIVTDSDELAEFLSHATLSKVGIIGHLMLLVKAVLLSTLLRPYLYWLPARLPFLKLGRSTFSPHFPLQRFTAFQAGIGRKMLQRLKKIHTGRVKKAEAIMQSFDNAGMTFFVRPSDEASPAFLRLPVIARDGLPEPKPELGIVPSYPTPLNEIQALKAHLVNDGRFPGAKFLAEHLLTLPTHEFVTASDIERIVAAYGAGN